MKTSFKGLEEEIDNLIMMHNNECEPEKMQNIGEELYSIARQLRANAQKINECFIKDVGYAEVGGAFDNDIILKHCELRALADRCEKQAAKTDCLIEELEDFEQSELEHERYYSAPWRYL